MLNIFSVAELNFVQCGGENFIEFLFVVPTYVYWVPSEFKIGYCFIFIEIWEEKNKYFFAFVWIDKA